MQHLSLKQKLVWVGSIGLAVILAAMIIALPYITNHRLAYKITAWALLGDVVFMMAFRYYTHPVRKERRIAKKAARA